jgi:hypothetical protein
MLQSNLREAEATSMSNHHTKHDHFHLPPTYIVGSHHEKEIKKVLRDQAEKNLIKWRQESEAAVSKQVSLKYPEQDPSTFPAWIALAGNIVWAATSTFSVPTKTAAVSMSFIGAGVPSIVNLVQAYESPGRNPSAGNFRSIISRKLSAMRDQLEKKSFIKSLISHSTKPSLGTDFRAKTNPMREKRCCGI